MIQRGFVVVRRRHRLQFEFHGFESGESECCHQALFGKTVVFVLVCADESYRPPHHRGLDRRPKLSFGLLPQVAYDSGDQVLQSQAPAEDICALETAAGQERLERLNQAVLRFGGKIFLNRFRAALGFDSDGAALLHLFEVEQ